MNFGWFVAISIALFAATPVFGEESDPKCDKYSSFITSAKGPETVLPESFLIDENRAVRCLTAALHSLSDQQNSSEFNRKVTVQMNIAAGALRRVIANAKNDRKPIEHIRKHDTPEMISLLAFGARSNDRTTRLNATRLLGDIVDNDSVCVVMDHFADPDFYTTGAGMSGRINLAAVVSVVAPWAFEENYNNIDKLNQYLGAEVKDDDDADKIKGVLGRMRERLDFQARQSRAKQKKLKPLKQASSDLQGCLSYKPQWARENANFKLVYPRQN